MSSNIKKALIAVVIIVAGFLIYVAMQPAEYMVAREITIKASPEVIFPYINSSKKAYEWMPWMEIDPGAVMTYSGPDEGMGSTSSWDSKGQMGTGQAAVVESVPNERVRTQLTYTKPMEMSQMAEVSITRVADGSLVRWSVSGKNSFVCRMMCVFMNMEKHVGGMFEKGLNKLKALVETPAATETPTDAQPEAPAENH